jgi:hypothetical protein
LRRAMAKVDASEVLKMLKRRLTKADADAGAKVAVGYTASYAIWVHEMIQGAPHPPKSDAQRKAMFASIRERDKVGHVSWSSGKPKFLEGPFRRMRKELQEFIRTSLKSNKMDVRQALYLAGLKLQRESQLVCPVDTGNLRASAFTRIEG